jgi:predicted transporter
MNHSLIKNATIASVVFCGLLLVVSALNYAFYSTESLIVPQLIQLSVLFAGIFSLHFWAVLPPKTQRINQILLSVLNIELIGSLVLSVLLILEITPFGKTLIILLSFQAMHGLLYFVNLFLQDERPIHTPSLSEEEILKKSIKRSASAAVQESDS